MSNIKRIQLLDGCLEFMDSGIFMSNIPESDFLEKINIIQKRKPSHQKRKTPHNSGYACSILGIEYGV
jgi:hypothetical protein